jgi:hypothetical protein
MWRHRLTLAALGLLIGFLGVTYLLFASNSTFGWNRKRICSEIKHRYAPYADSGWEHNSLHAVCTHPTYFLPGVIPVSCTMYCLADETVERSDDRKYTVAVTLLTRRPIRGDPHADNREIKAGDLVLKISEDYLDDRLPLPDGRRSHRPFSVQQLELELPYDSFAGGVDVDELIVRLLKSVDGSLSIDGRFALDSVAEDFRTRVIALESESAQDELFVRSYSCNWWLAASDVVEDSTGKLAPDRSPSVSRKGHGLGSGYAR